MISTGTGEMFHDYLTWSVSNLVPVKIFYWRYQISFRPIFYNSVYIIVYSLHKNDTICVICVFILIFAFL